MNKQALIIGGSSKIGKAFADKLRKSQIDFYLTTRNSITTDNEIYFDLSCSNYGDILRVAKDAAILFAGVTSIEECQRRPRLTRSINVISTVSLVKELLRKNIFVIYLSSSAVFDGELPWPNEYSKLCPAIEYGYQKAEAERRLLDIPNSESLLAIVRITKVLTNSEHSIENTFFSKLRNNQTIEPFEDLIISPVSADYVIENIYNIFKKRLTGIYHISGNDEISYADLCYKLADKYNFDQNLIKPIKIINSRFNNIFMPKHPGLGMEATCRVLKITPEETNDMLKIFNKRDK